MSEQFRFTKGQKPRLVNKEELVFKPSPEFKREAHFSSYNQYKNIYDFSIRNPDKFWGSEAKELHWFKRWKDVKQGKAFNSKWFTGGKTNVSYNCLDRHIETDKRNKAAIIWESETGDTRIFTYQLLHTQVCKFANALLKLGVKKGDNIIIYMGIIPEAVIAMLACARIGAIHSVVFNGLSANAVSDRINSLDCKTIITQDFFLRKGNNIPLKENVDNAIGKNSSVENVIVYRRFESSEVELTAGRDHYWRQLLESAPDNCEAVPLDSQHPLFSMFTNGPRGHLVKTLHTTGGYMVQVYISARWLFDLKDEDIVWTTSDIGWISCHSYGIYGPLLNGATTFLYEGVPIYPEPDRYWQLISKFRINIFFTTPTTLRAFLKLGNDWVNKHDLTSLRLLGTKGEPIKPETWLWYYETVGKKLCPIVNGWLQTETGTIIISRLPGASEMRPGVTGIPFPGVEVEVVDIKGNPVAVNKGGYLIIKDSWPSMFTTERDEKQEAKLNCWEQFKGNYFTGDAAIKEKNGFIRILGRVDDVIKAAGNRVGGSEIEKILLSNENVKEAAVVKRPDEIIGNAIIAYVSLKEEIEPTPLLREELRNYVVDNIGSIAKPDELKFIDEMPKLDNGKTDRGKLRELALEGTPELKGVEEAHIKILEELREEYQKLYLS